jgi:hypothetical protein
LVLIVCSGCRSTGGTRTLLGLSFAFEVALTFPLFPGTDVENTTT